MIIMSVLYLSAHGMTSPLDEVIRVPAGVTLHYYGLPGEKTYSMAFLYLLAGGSMKPARTVTGPARVAQLILEPVTDDEYAAEKELAGISGVELLCAGHDGVPLPLCTKPLGPLAWSWSPCTSAGHTCDGFLGTYPEATEIHLSACQSYANIGTALGKVTKWLLEYFPQNTVVQGLADKYGTRATPATLTVGDDTVEYDPNHGGEPFEPMQESTRFRQLADLDKHAAWQRFLSYPAATKILMLTQPGFRRKLETVQRAVVKPAGKGWLRLGELAALQGMDPEDVLAVLRSSSDPVPLGPSVTSFEEAARDNGLALAYAEYDPRKAKGREAASWLGLFRDWLVTPDGCSASGIDARAAIGLVNWCASAWQFCPQRDYERVRMLLDISESMQDTHHPVTLLMPQYPAMLAAALETYIGHEQWLHSEVDLCRGLTHFDHSSVSPVDDFTEHDTIRQLISRFEQYRSQLREQPDQLGTEAADHGESGPGALGGIALQTELDALDTSIATAHTVLAVLAEMAQACTTANEAVKAAVGEGTALLEPAFDQFRNLTFTLDDLA
ncbi:hypothetical protein [Streptomyces sp. NPDC057910]|uniref:hypothetical protein n=1 Tax=Streptomyces sp. NPDC057910 TaxID=3346278 RepID=UPI0036ECAC3F